MSCESSGRRKFLKYTSASFLFPISLDCVGNSLESKFFLVSDIKNLRKFIPQLDSQVVYVLSYYSEANNENHTGGGFFIAEKNSDKRDNHGTIFRVNDDWVWLRQLDSMLCIEDFGAIGNGVSLVQDEVAKNAAIDYCDEHEVDLFFSGGTYCFSTALYWNCKRHSIVSLGKSVLNFNSLETNSFAILIKGDRDRDGTIWHTITTKFSGFIIAGNAKINGVHIDSENSAATPAINFENILFESFRDHLNFGNNEWIVCFNRCFFRGGGRHIVIDKTCNGCENQVFQNCTFSGSNSATAIHHISGTCEFTFNSCSFDYLNEVIKAEVVSRAIFRFNDCHFESDGNGVNFNINSGKAPYYLTFSSCDWYYVDNIPSNIGTFKSINNNSILTLRDCRFPIYTVARDKKRDKAELFVIPESSSFQVLAVGNRVEQGTGDFANVFSRKNNKLTKSILIKNDFREIINADFSSSYALQSDFKKKVELLFSYEIDKVISFIFCLKVNAGNISFSLSYMSKGNDEIYQEAIFTSENTKGFLRFGKVFHPPVETDAVKLVISYFGDVIVSELLVEQY